MRHQGAGGGQVKRTVSTFAITLPATPCAIRLEVCLACIAFTGIQTPGKDGPAFNVDRNLLELTTLLHKVPNSLELADPHHGTPATRVSPGLASLRYARCVAARLNAPCFVHRSRLMLA